MSTSKEYIEFLMEQLSGLDDVYYRKMMGEYLIYYKGKVAAYVCDNRFLIRPVPSAVSMFPGAEYDGISEDDKKNLIRVDDVDNSELLMSLFIAIYDELPFPKQKKKARH